MNIKPPQRMSFVAMTIFAIAAAAVAVSILTGAVVAFTEAGVPLGQLREAELECAEQYAYVSERQACMREWIAAARAARVATR